MPPPPPMLKTIHWNFFKYSTYLFNIQFCSLCTQYSLILTYIIWHLIIYFLISAGGAYNPSRCQGLEVVDPKYFFPIPWVESTDMIIQRKSLQEWEDFFKDAYSADFFASSGASLSNMRVQRAQFYGRQKPAFLYLGPKYCPTSYFSAKLFWIIPNMVCCINQLLNKKWRNSRYLHFSFTLKKFSIWPLR